MVAKLLTSLLKSLVIAVVACSVTQAAIIFDNFGPGDAFSATGRILEGSDGANVNQAAQFTVPGTDFLLTSVSLGITVRETPAIGTGPLDVVVAADNAGSPGATLRTLPIDVNSTGMQVITVADDGSFTLLADTDYWIIADPGGSFDGSWNFNTVGDIGLTAGQTEGNPWNLRPDDDRYAMRVEGRIVPEPATWWLLVCLAGLPLICRSRRNTYASSSSTGVQIMSRQTTFSLGVMLLMAAPLAQADEVSGVYFDVNTCDNHGVQVATEELGDPMIFSPTQQIAHAATFLQEPACLPTDDPNIPNVVVEIINFTGRSWTDLYYVGDSPTTFSNVDGIGDAGVFADVDGLAFRIDSVGINRPLIFESAAANDIFEPGEAWQFIVQDYSSPVGAADAFFSIGFADASLAVIDVSTASIVHFVVPEPVTGWMLALGFCLLMVRRQKGN